MLKSAVSATASEEKNRRDKTRAVVLVRMAENGTTTSAFPPLKGLNSAADHIHCRFTIRLREPHEKRLYQPFICRDVHRQRRGAHCGASAEFRHSGWRYGKDRGASFQEHPGV